MGEERVLHVMGPSTGGIRRHVGYVTGELRRRGWEVEVAGPPGVMEGIGDQHHVVSIPARLSPAGLVSAAAARRSLARAMEGASLVHAHGLKAGWVAASLRSRPPLVVSLHNVVLGRGPIDRVLRIFEWRLPPRADHVIAVSHQIARDLESRSKGVPVAVVPPAGPPPAPIRSREEVRRSLGIGSHVPLVVAVARLHPQKDLATLLEAVARLRVTLPSVRAAVVGDGPLAEDLRALAARLGLADAVVFTGPRPCPAEEMVAADAVAVTSVWESGPLVALEAAHLGRPLVSTPVGLVPDLVVDGETGLLVPPGHPDALAAALGRLLADPARAAAMGRAAARRAAEQFAPDVLVTGVEDVYRAALGATVHP